MTGSFTPEQTAVLLKPIKPNRVARRDGLSNVEGYEIRAHLTRIFGFGHWDDVAVNPTVLLYEQETTTKAGKPAYKVAYRAERALVIRDHDGFEVCRYEGSAVGESIMPEYLRGDAHDMALKVAETQALKRAAVNLGDQFGLSLYRKGSTDALVGKVVGFDPGDGPTPEMHEPDVVEGYDPDVAGDVADAADAAELPPAPEFGTDPDFDVPPELDEPEQLPLAEAGPVVIAVTPAQIKRMQTTFGVMGMRDRAEKLDYIGAIVGRVVESSKELTMDEAKMVIDRMETERNRQAIDGSA